jgi:putative transposase
MVFCPKYRAQVLTGDVAVECERVIREVCADLGIHVIDMAVNPDHVHLFIRYPPKYSMSWVAQKIKSVSSFMLRKKFPHLKKWRKKGLWAPSCWHGSVGQGFEVVQKYIQGQEGHRD